MTYIEIIILIVAGIFAGFINTLAGGGSIVSLSVLMLRLIQRLRNWPEMKMSKYATIQLFMN